MTCAAASNPAVEGDEPRDALAPPQFLWQSPRAIPPRYDLRHRGWTLLGFGGCDPGVATKPVLIDAGALGQSKVERMFGGPARAFGRVALLLGIGSGEDRAALLRLGFGDVLGPDALLCEIEERARRIAENAAMLPRAREVGRLRLDLIARDGFVDGRPLGLHPREFELIWRLSETPGLPVGKRDLLNQVWRMSHMPDTNSIAVHIFRLRTKLGIAGLGDMVGTAPSGGYFLASPSAIGLATASHPPGIALAGDELVDRTMWTGNTRPPAIAPRSQGHAT